MSLKNALSRKFFVNSFKRNFQNAVVVVVQPLSMLLFGGVRNMKLKFKI